MEFLQIYLPRRVPSNLDFVLNAAGAVAGGALAWTLHAVGAAGTLEGFSRALALAGQPRGGLLLLALWPGALLFPLALPFGLGQVLEHLDEALARWLQGSPFMAGCPCAKSPWCR